MLKRLLSTLRPAQPSHTPNIQEDPERPAERVGVPIYPPVDRGVAFLDTEDLLASQSEMIGRLRLAAGCDDKAFERLYGCVLRNLADAINLLPATEAGTHNGAGGLFRLSLEIGFYAFQASEATIFSARAGVEQRRELEPRWRYATFLAGTCSELHRPITQMIVNTPGGQIWPAYQYGLGEWLRMQGTNQILVRWMSAPPGAHRPGQGAAPYLAHRIIPPSSLQYLHEGAIDIAPTLFDCIAGVRSGQFEASPLQKIITSVRDKVIARDEALKPQRYGKLRVGSHLEPHLLDAMRRLAADRVWRINVEKARLWYSKEGLFLVWKTAAKEILAMLARDGIQGIPQDPQTLAELLVTAGVFATNPEGNPYLTIRPPGGQNDLIAVRFSDPLTLIGSLEEDPTPIATVMGDSRDSTSSLTSTAPQVSSPPEPVASPDEASPPTQSDFVPAPVEGEQGAVVAPPGRPVPPRRVQSSTEHDVGANVPDTLGKSVTPLCRDVIGALIDDMRTPGVVVQAGKHPLGFAIGLEQVAAYGVDATRFVTEVSQLGWLVPHPEKPTRKFHDAQFGKKQARAIVIKLPIAIDLGLTA